jgi:hypothetical protein
MPGEPREWRRLRVLNHPQLARGRLRVEWLHGRWVPLCCTWPNGYQEDGLEALQSYGLALRNPFHPVPKIIPQEDV